MYLLDTDILVDILRGYQPALDWFNSLPERPNIPSFVVMELIQGTQNKQQLSQVLRLVEPLPILWISQPSYAFALSKFTAYHLSHKLGLIDALIAGCAVGHNLTLCTFNVKHFGVVPELKTTQPYSR